MKGTCYKSVVAGVLLASCGLQQNPATGGRMLSLMSEQQEFAMGHEVAEKSVVEYGGTYDEKPALSAYIRDNVSRLVAVGERPDKPFEAKLLDDPIMNAFAVPGYVMVSRGILPFFQNEAEMMFVLGHEVGHVTGQHHVRSHSRQLLTSGALLIATQIIANQTDSNALTQGALAGASFAVPFGMAHFSRAQELEADMLGVRYMSKLGYPAFESSDVFRMFDAYGTLNNNIMASAGASQQKSMFHRALASHPDDMTRINQAASSAGANRGADNGQERYLSMIDGLAFGPKLSDGVVSKHRYLNPVYGVRFDIPQMFQVSGMDGMPIGVEPRRQAVLDVKVVEDVPQSSDVTTVMKKGLAGVRDIRTVKKAPFEVAVADAVVNGKAVRYMGTLAKAQGSDKDVLLLVMVRSGGTTFDSALQTTVNQMAQSMRALTVAQSRSVESLRIQVRTVKAGETLSSLAAQLPFDVYKEEWFKLLNGLYRGEVLKAGMRVKMVVDPNANKAL